MRTARTIVIALIAFSSLVSFAGAAAQTDASQSQAQDIWKPFRFFEGRWEGTGQGKPGVSHGKQTWGFILRGKYLQVRNEARFEPQGQNPAGEVHEDFGLISYDTARKKYVFRQFHVEGFVNQYVSDGPAADGKTFVFVSEAIENIPPGFSARLTYRILDENSFEQTFDLAAPGQEFACYSKGVMKRVK